MGKILKFCSSCEEGFAEKFSFCPNCANELAAFEMKPVADKASSNEVEKTIEDIPEEVQSVAETVEDIPVVASAETVEDIPAVVDSEIETAYETKPLDEETIFEPIAFESDPAEIAVSEDVTEIEVEEPAEEETNEYAAAAPIIADESYASTQSESDSFEEATDVEVEAEQTDYSYRFEDETLDDNDYGVTVIEDSGNKMRSSLLLGASVLVLTIAIGGLGYSLFNHPLFMAAIDGDVSLLAPVDIGPVEIEEKKPEPKKNDEEDSGGGGGGNERKKPPSRGELPSQTRDKIPPIMPVKRMDNPSLVVINKTDGDIKRKRNDRIGLPKGMSGDISSGTGTGGGFGTGKGKGVGSGIGTGEGSGIGSGSGKWKRKRNWQWNWQRRESQASSNTS